VKVDHALASQRLAENGHVVPRFPKVKVSFGPVDDQGLADMTIEGSAHATEEDVARALGLPVDTQTIKRTESNTVGYVVSEPARPPSPGAVASRGTIKRTSPKPPVQDPRRVDANVKTQKRVRTAGRRK
jgi:hypothetical protein